ncbi:MAG: hypothetical protein ASARMPRED_006064 [Alectoria sarmentosa]|nr:MAG: hypothetical protein ASARMPRED_006064 [Alectoria sarmentosa]
MGAYSELIGKKDEQEKIVAIDFHVRLNMTHAIVPDPSTPHSISCPNFDIFSPQFKDQRGRRTTHDCPQYPITSLVGSTNYCGYLRVAFSTYITAPECDRNKSMTKSEEAFYKEWKSSIRRVMVGEKQDWIDEEYKPATKETILRTGPAGSNRTLNTRNGTAEGDRALELLRQAISARRDVTMAQEFGVRTAGSLGRSPRTKKGCYGVRPKTNLVE